MKKALLFGCILGLALSAHGGERVYCAITMPTDAGSASTAGQISAVGCAANLLQTDGGYLAWDGGNALTLANGQPGDGGVGGCNACSWGQAQRLFLQCDNPVYYRDLPDGGVNAWGQSTVFPATPAAGVLVDFDINPDPYRIDLRGQGHHISVVSVGLTANTCKVGTVERKVP